MSNPFKTAADVSPLLAERVHRTQIRPDGWVPTGDVARGGGHAVFIGAFPSNSEGWHELRATRLGGSEIGTIAKLSKYASPYKLWHEKRGDLPREDISDRPMIEWGHRLEEAVGAKLCENHPELGMAPQVGTFVHSERPWQLANPDLLGPSALGEVKTAAYDYAWGPDGSDQIPLHYRAQVTWYMDVLMLDEARLCVLIGGSDYREYLIPYDLADALYLRTLGADFMASLEAGVAPEPDGSEATSSALSALLPDPSDMDVQIPAELALAYEKAMRAFEAAEAEKKRLSNAILVAIGSGRRAVVGETPIAARARSSHGSIYLRADRRLMVTRAKIEASIPAPRGFYAELAEVADLAELERFIGQQPARTLNDDRRAAINTHWRKLKGL